MNIFSTTKYQLQLRFIAELLPHYFMQCWYCCVQHTICWNPAHNMKGIIKTAFSSVFHDVFLTPTTDSSSFGFDSLGGFSFADLARNTESFAFGTQGQLQHWHLLRWSFFVTADCCCMLLATHHHKIIFHHIFIGSL